MLGDLQVLDLEVVFPNYGRRSGGGVGVIPRLPLLRMNLEDGSEFTMAGIPPDTAIAILQKLQDKPNPDSRYSCQNVICDISQVISTTIDCIVPRSSAYAATMRLKVEGFASELQFQMVPSQAVLLALTAHAPIFVSRELIELQKTPKE